MTILFLILPLAIGLSALVGMEFLWATLKGQLDDLETPPVRLLCDELREPTGEVPRGAACETRPMSSKAAPLDGRGSSSVGVSWWARGSRPERCVKMFGKRLLSLLGGLFLLAASATPASAAAIVGKVCSVSFTPAPASNGHGSDGYVSVNFYTGASCTGTNLGSFYFCSPGATSSDCVVLQEYRYNAAALLTTYELLARAADTNQTVDYATLSCMGGGGSCITWARFRAN